MIYGLSFNGWFGMSTQFRLALEFLAMTMLLRTHRDVSCRTRKRKEVDAIVAPTFPSPSHLFIGVCNISIT
jgi:hypothetical protein